MAKYEIMLLISGKVTTQEATNAAEQLPQNIKANPIETKYLGAKELAYPIKHEKTGHYFQINFDGEPKSFFDFNRLALINKSVLRHLIVNLEKDYGWRAINNEKKVKLSKNRETKYEEIIKNPEGAKPIPRKAKFEKAKKRDEWELVKRFGDGSEKPATKQQVVSKTQPPKVVPTNEQKPKPISERYAPRPSEPTSQHTVKVPGVNFEMKRSPMEPFIDKIDSKQKEKVVRQLEPSQIEQNTAPLINAPTVVPPPVEIPTSVPEIKKVEAQPVPIIQPPKVEHRVVKPNEQPTTVLPKKVESKVEEPIVVESAKPIHKPKLVFVKSESEIANLKHLQPVTKLKPVKKAAVKKSAKTTPAKKVSVPAKVVKKTAAAIKPKTQNKKAPKKVATKSVKVAKKPVAVKKAPAKKTTTVEKTAKKK